MNAIAIDDEPIALDVVKSLAEKVPFLKLEACFMDAFIAADYLQNNKVDLLFLDIKMPDISGLEFLKTLPQAPMVIFTTAYAEHAVQSFELDAVDYLLKPFSQSRFLKACMKANELLQLRSGKETDPIIFVKSGYEQIRIDLNEVLFIESEGNYVRFTISSSDKIISRQTMSEIQEMLPATQFYRIHRSYIVNRNRIDKIEKTQVWLDKHCIPVGAAYTSVLEQIIGKGI